MIYQVAPKPPPLTGLALRQDASNRRARMAEALVKLTIALRTEQRPERLLMIRTTVAKHAAPTGKPPTWKAVRECELVVRHWTTPELK